MHHCIVSKMSVSVEIYQRPPHGPLIAKHSLNFKIKIEPHTAPAYAPKS